MSRTTTEIAAPPMIAQALSAFVCLATCMTISAQNKVPSTAMPMPFSHEMLDNVLSNYVDNQGRVDYVALKAEPQKLDAYYQLVATYSPDTHPKLFPTTNHELAYWINAYNTAVIKTVLAYYPIAGVGDVKPPTLLFFMPDHSGFFYFQQLVFGGNSMNLYNLEHNLIRKRYKDPRIHFALNCASIGCPRLPRHAFTADNLSEELDREARRFINEQRNFRVNNREQVLLLSSIFIWYESDFVDWYAQRYPDQTASLLNYTRLYLSPELLADVADADRYKVQTLPYNWNLNDTTPQ